MRPLFPLLIGMSVSLGLWASAPRCWAGLAQGVAAYKQGDFATALGEFLPLAQQGGAEAQFYLGVMYTKGWGIPQDATTAAHWYQQAATQGLAEAQLNLGGMYSRGEGVPHDLVQAYRWLALAATHFPSGASQEKAVHARDAVAAQLTPAQLAQAHALISQWRPRQAP